MSLAAALLVFTCVVITAAPASANFVTNNSRGWTNCPPTNQPPHPCKGDSRTHDVWGGLLGPRMGNATFATLFNSYDTTDITIVSGGSHTTYVDVLYSYQNLPGSLVGQYDCIYLYSGFTCSHSHVYYDGDAISGYSDNALQRLACHETGHTLGLTHGGDGLPVVSDADPIVGCLRTPLQGSELLGGHNVSHINGNY